ncbi:hypothetical protein O6H91_01G035400 [Diphasiastrum complanatum]|uniref:Uncharacterized protein n=1 Tax=Diphasiastrum complanatum TaxID=34168 RepID=A0ACC2EQ20_DIPCM|nr:hypothetical protein O6H91_01G035400 [Diphasiastrum complanatum]
MMTSLKDNCKILCTVDVSKDILGSLSDLPLPPSLQPLVKTFIRSRYSCWPLQSPLPLNGTPFTHWGRMYMIMPSEHLPEAGLGLFALSSIEVPLNTVVTLMPYAEPQYNWGNWHDLCRHQWRMQVYGLNSNACSLEEQRMQGGNISRANCTFIDGRPDVHGNIATYINCSNVTNCDFEERTNGKEEYFTRNVKGTYVMVYATRSIRFGEELFIKYSFNRPLPKCLQKTISQM